MSLVFNKEAIYSSFTTKSRDAIPTYDLFSGHASNPYTSTGTRCTMKSLCAILPILPKMLLGAR